MGWMSGCSAACCRAESCNDDGGGGAGGGSGSGSGGSIAGGGSMHFAMPCHAMPAILRRRRDDSRQSDRQQAIFNLSVRMGTWTSTRQEDPGKRLGLFLDRPRTPPRIIRCAQWEWGTVELGLLSVPSTG